MPERSQTDFRSLYFADGEVDDQGVSQPFEVLRVGKTNHPAFGETNITEADLDRAVANFEAMRSAGAEVPIDYDHSFAEGGSSVAAGWIKELVRKGKSLFARVKWTDKAREQISAEEYKYISAEFSEDWADERGDKHGFTLLAAGLTNRPFLKGMTPVALSERIPAEDVRFVHPAVTIGTSTNTGTWTFPAAVSDVSPGGSETQPRMPEPTKTPEKTEPKADEPKDKTVTLSEKDHKDLLERAETGDEKAKTYSEQVKTLSEKVTSLESDLRAEQLDKDLGQARREGRIPADEDTTKKWTERYEKLGRETARELLFELPADTVPVKERGTGVAPDPAESVPEGTDPEAHDLDREIKAKAKADDISYAEAAEKVFAEKGAKV